MNSDRKQRMTGEEWDYTSKQSRRLFRWRAGEGKRIKRALARRRRQVGKVAR